MTDQQRGFLASLCTLTMGEANRRIRDWHEVGMAASLSVFETNTAVHALEVDGFIFTSPGGDVWLSRVGAALGPSLTHRVT